MKFPWKKEPSDDGDRHRWWRMQVLVDAFRTLLAVLRFLLWLHWFDGDGPGGSAQ